MEVGVLSTLTECSCQRSSWHEIPFVCFFLSGIGMVIGHEITHGFDDTGRQYDENGNRVSWWSNSTIENFNKRKQCIIDQYSNYTVEQIHKNVSFIRDKVSRVHSTFSFDSWTANRPKARTSLTTEASRVRSMYVRLNESSISRCDKDFSWKGLSQLVTQ